MNDIGCSTTHPCCIVDVCKMSYFYSYFLKMVAWGDLLLQYVDLTKYIQAGVDCECGLFRGHCVKNAKYV